MNAAFSPVAEFAVESMGLVRSEIEPLLAKHWQEVAHFRDIPLKPNWPAYEKLADAGALIVYTARLEGRLVGYAVYLKIVSMHYSIVQAQQDIVFLDPAVRRGRLALRLLAFSENDLRARGVTLIQQHEKLAHPALGVLLGAMGYTAMDRIWVKRL
jgi:GNAT superfamily N-acetyltransferase